MVKMDDMAARISEMLGDPSTVERLQGLASQIMGGDGGVDLSKLGTALGGEQPQKKQPESVLTPEQMGGVMKIMSALNSGRGDSRTALLTALRPYLTAERQQRLDTAVKLLKIASVLPLISESGLFNL